MIYFHFQFNYKKLLENKNVPTLLENMDYSITMILENHLDWFKLIKLTWSGLRQTSTLFRLHNQHNSEQTKSYVRSAVCFAQGGCAAQHSSPLVSKQYTCFVFLFAISSSDLVLSISNFWKCVSFYCELSKSFSAYLHCREMLWGFEKFGMCIIDMWVLLRLHLRVAMQGGTELIERACLSYYTRI